MLQHIRSGLPDSGEPAGLHVGRDSVGPAGLQVLREPVHVGRDFLGLAGFRVCRDPLGPSVLRSDRSAGLHVRRDPVGAAGLHMYVGRDTVEPASLRVRRDRLSPADLRVGRDPSLTAGLLLAKIGAGRPASS